jgi:hypothetical protein
VAAVVGDVDEQISPADSPPTDLSLRQPDPVEIGAV